MIATIEPLNTEAIRRICFRPEEAAASVGVSPRTLERWEKQGIGPPLFRVGNVTLYPIAELEKWAADQSRASNPAAVGDGAGRLPANFPPSATPRESRA